MPTRTGPPKGTRCRADKPTRVYTSATDNGCSAEKGCREGHPNNENSNTQHTEQMVHGRKQQVLEQAGTPRWQAGRMWHGSTPQEAHQECQVQLPDYDRKVRPSPTKECAHTQIDVQREMKCTCNVRRVGQLCKACIVWEHARPWQHHTHMRGKKRRRDRSLPPVWERRRGISHSCVALVWDSCGVRPSPASTNKPHHTQPLPPQLATAPGRKPHMAAAPSARQAALDHPTGTGPQLLCSLESFGHAA